MKTIRTKGRGAEQTAEILAALEQRGGAALDAVLPALNSPTVSQLSNSDWVAVNTIVEERVARDVIPRLKAAKATGIVEYPLNKVVL